MLINQCNAEQLDLLIKQNKIFLCTDSFVEREEIQNLIKKNKINIKYIDSETNTFSINPLSYLKTREDIDAFNTLLYFIIFKNENLGMVYQNSIINFLSIGTATALSSKENATLIDVFNFLYRFNEALTPIVNARRYFSLPDFLMKALGQMQPNNQSMYDIAESYVKSLIHKEDYAGIPITKTYTPILPYLVGKLQEFLRNINAQQSLASNQIEFNDKGNAFYVIKENSANEILKIIVGWVVVFNKNCSAITMKEDIQKYQILEDNEQVVYQYQKPVEIKQEVNLPEKEIEFSTEENAAEKTLQAETGTAQQNKKFKNKKKNKTEKPKKAKEIKTKKEKESAILNGNSAGNIIIQIIVLSLICLVANAGFYPMFNFGPATNPTSIITQVAAIVVMIKLHSELGLAVANIESKLKILIVLLINVIVIAAGIGTRYILEIENTVFITENFIAFNLLFQSLMLSIISIGSCILKKK